MDGCLFPPRAPSWTATTADRRAPDGVGTVAHDCGNWNVFYLDLHGMNFDANRERCPRTCEFLASLPRGYCHAFFSALAPHTHVVKHHGPTNKKLRIHLPLIAVPPGLSRLRVGDEVRVIEEGKLLVFDDSFEHEAWNDGETARITLIIDIWHPDLSHREVRWLAFLQKALLRTAMSASAGGEETDTFASIISRARGITPDMQDVWE
ncbi:unnamed protein product [Chrysoparadoxa australica]